MRPRPLEKKHSRRRADTGRARRLVSTTSRETPIRVPVRDPHRDKRFDSIGDATKDTTVAVRVFTAPEYEIIDRIEDLPDRELYLAKKKNQYAFARPVMVERLSRSEPDFEQLERRLIDEASLLARFDHPNVLQLVELAGDEAFVYLAMEHVDGAPLEKIAGGLRAKHRALPFEISAHLMLEVLRGVHHVHTRQGEKRESLGIVLRDLTPAQLLISRTGQARIALLGIGPSLSLRPRDEARSLSRRTCAFLAPECVEGSNGSIAADIYSIGVIFYELLSGRECFSGRSAIEVLEEITGTGVSTRALERDGVPRVLIDIVQRATARVAGNRFRSAAEMADAIESWLIGLARPPTPSTVERFFASHGFFSAAESFDPLAGEVVPMLRAVRGRSAVIKQAAPAALVEDTAPIAMPKKRAPVTARVAVERRSRDVAEKIRAGAAVEKEGDLDEGVIFHGLSAPDGPWSEGALPLISIDSQIHQVLELAQRPGRGSRPTGAAQPYLVKGAVKAPGAADRLAELRKRKRGAIAVRVLILLALSAALAAMVMGLLPLPVIS